MFVLVISCSLYMWQAFISLFLLLSFYFISVLENIEVDKAADAVVSTDVAGVAHIAPEELDLQVAFSKRIRLQDVAAECRCSEPRARQGRIVAAATGMTAQIESLRAWCHRCRSDPDYVGAHYGLGFDSAQVTVTMDRAMDEDGTPTP